MAPYVLWPDDVDPTQVEVVGGKAAQLARLSRIDEVDVPRWFCVTTDAFRRAVDALPGLGRLLDALSQREPDDRDGIAALSADLRRSIETTALPADVLAATAAAVRRLGAGTPCAVRSSATTEDLSTGSFAGLHDSFLDVLGPEAVEHHLARCWASLFTERAVAYRTRQGIDHRQVEMAVVVQELVRPRSAGTLFTADPLSGNRRVAVVEAVHGLGDALVSGLVTPDVYRVRDDAVVAGPSAARAGDAAEPHEQHEPALTEDQAVGLVQLGRRIESHLDAPQDIEWCLRDEGFSIVQSRPITTLFPLPANVDGGNHVYVSVGHAQMMTDAMKPLGISLWQLTAMAPMLEAGGRLFVDATRQLASPQVRDTYLEMVGRSDPLTRDALQTLLDRGFVPQTDRGGTGGGEPPRLPLGGAAATIDTDPSIVTALVARSQESIAALRRDIAAQSGPDLFAFLLSAFDDHKRVLADPLSMQAIMAGMQATWWLNDHLREWLGETNAADTLTLSAPGNITSEMGLALLDVADVIRPLPEVVAFLERVADEDFLDRLPGVPGGTEARDAIQAYLDRYGMRCVGEIDVTRPRWSERPTTLLPLILDNVRLFPPGEAGRRFEQGRQRAEAKEREVLARVRALPDGAARADEVERMIARVRTFIGYREYPKYDIVSRYLLYKQALLREAGRLVSDGVLRELEDAYFLTFEEFRDASLTGRVDTPLVQQRKDSYRWYRTLTPPRVLTSEGEAITGAYRRSDVPAGALVGLAVSRGTVEGRARIVLDLAPADLRAGDILVTRSTDPSWSPLFLAVAGLVTEVGGLMTHGAVIAREYGLPAVVGVQGATTAIHDGQRIRVHGTDGYVEVLA